MQIKSFSGRASPGPVGGAHIAPPHLAEFTCKEPALRQGGERRGQGKPG